MKPTQTKPSIVFCHGLWADGSCFSKLIVPLQAEGYECIAAQYGLNTTAEDVALVKATIGRVSGPVILVGHSYGGTVITGAGARPPAAGETVPPLDDTAQALCDFAGDGVSDKRTPEQTAAALLNAARHQRERKPYWWAHFQRLNHPVDEWGDTSGVFLVEDAEVVADWHLPPRARKPRRHVRLTGVLQGGLLDDRARRCTTVRRPLASTTSTRTAALRTT